MAAKKLSKKTKQRRKEEIDLRVEILETTSKLMTAGFGLVAALAWNEAIKALFSRFFPQPQSNVIALTIYALIITIMAVVITVQLGKALNLAKKRIKK